MASFLQLIPNTLTLLNLLSGCLGIAFAFTGRYQEVLYCLAFSLIMDFLDGTAARAFKAQSPIGKELDSLSDAVSFGVMPAALLFQFALDYWLRVGDCFGLTPGMELLKSEGYPLQAMFFAGVEEMLKSLPVFLYTAFAALRLARFNVDTAQSKSSLGLPSPAAAALIVGLYPLHMFSLKISVIREEGFLFPAILLILAVIFLIVFNFAAISLIVMAYIILAAIHNIYNSWNSSPK
jgi:CDP-diacylglycerol--serine O-phosphatidyltransferase